MIQAWDERWAVWVRLPDSLDPAAPFAGPGGGVVRSGSLARVAAPLLPLQAGLLGP